ncbi:hypothetical protein [Haloarcula laminariae]|uniref:hypothetical protein n=1 Tax=Haloarcula laminariae TaxID=2961577 RepID=UPI0021C85E2E|nr:hypothetical protein [Halomicroarcula laminariae]
MVDDTARTAAMVLLVVGVAALLVPALFPVQQVLYHDTGDGTMENRSQLEAEGYTVIAYENLSERGQEIYVSSLRSPNHEYTVPVGEGAPEFPYDEANNVGEVTTSEEYEERQRRTSVVIERPDNADLPPPDEPVDRIRVESPNSEEAADGRTASGGETTETSPEQSREQRVEQRRQVIATYDMLTVRQGTPPATHRGTLLRLGSVLFGAVAIGVGGYLRSRP